MNTESERIDIYIEDTNLDIEFEDHNIELNEDVARVFEKKHSNLENLDFENSGHTGFQPAGNYVVDEKYVHTDNNFTDEDKEKLDSLENISVDAKNIPFEDNYGYGTPDNIQDALDFAFEELDDRATYSDLLSYVSYNAQSPTAIQQQKAINNIGISKFCVMSSQTQNLSEKNKQIARKNIDTWKFVDLGEIDLADYDDNIWAFIDVLTEEGTYKFVDNSEYFTWVVEVWRLGDYSIGQKYFVSDEGYTQQYCRNGYYDEDSDTISWDEWTLYITYEDASNRFALKSHSHSSNLTTSLDIRGYLDTLTNYNIKDYRITSSQNKHLYRVKADYINYNLTAGGTRYVRYQEYYDIEEPNKIYKRTGLFQGGTATNIKWGDWYVFEGVSE